MGVKDKMMHGQVANCFARYILEGQKEYELSDDESAFLAGAMVNCARCYELHASYADDLVTVWSRIRHRTYLDNA